MGNQAHAVFGQRMQQEGTDGEHKTSVTPGRFEPGKGYNDEQCLEQHQAKAEATEPIQHEGDSLRTIKAKSLHPER
ncbi:hypothetical protein GCM10007392_28550 [Saccharospirillum salsuginis]|uniref:Uncharacterized protein n=1 Tax=Saccharospirillum salsuginis TaxID=418750 RepID=A0A918KD18_9GAMM|nr:hypothetical protein GCM10007392_28550 [Saccharospirillum salsuginis]